MDIWRETKFGREERELKEGLERERKLCELEKISREKSNGKRFS